ncbi:hypothetical protein [Methylobacterium sp. Leaf118]|uniref:hypothetical protein n=1 Tax=Methylobacterium sp. Leaf118 TaxID=2876562 RepID=UPI001E34A01C|nr:hypothetical protein [Methylobacterium sp. Leaf118]
MIALLANERWFEDWSQPATYLWYLSTAPAEILEFKGAQGAAIIPRQIGRMAFDVALTVALEAMGRGRLWLHADPAGGDRLVRWSTQMVGMRTIDPAQHPKLPGSTLTGGRRNDGRYLYLDAQAALQTHAALAPYWS